MSTADFLTKQAIGVFMDSIENFRNERIWCAREKRFINELY